MVFGLRRIRFRYPTLLADARVSQRVKEISEEIHGHIGKADHEDAALNEIVVAAADGADG
jgi:hypothetical protein